MVTPLPGVFIVMVITGGDRGGGVSW